MTEPCRHARLLGNALPLDSRDDCRKVVVKPITSVIGAEISGVDLRTPLDPQTVTTIKSAWYQYAISLLRDQHLSEGTFEIASPLNLFFLFGLQ